MTKEYTQSKYFQMVGMVLLSKEVADMKIRIDQLREEYHKQK